MAGPRGVRLALRLPFSAPRRPLSAAACLCRGGGAAWGPAPPLLNPAREGRERRPAPAPLRVPRRPGEAGAGVRRVLGRTRPPRQAFLLERWRRRMVQELGPEGFAEHVAQLFHQGKLFHAALEALLLADESPVKEQEEHPSIGGYLASIQHVLPEISGVRALESAVQHEALHYHGIVDCVAEYRGTLCVIDWKTSGKSKPLLQNTFDDPLQIAAYIGALNHDAHYDFQVDCGLLVIAYKDGSPAHPHRMDSELCSQYWTQWLLRLKEFREQEKASGAACRTDPGLAGRTSLPLGPEPGWD